MNENKAHISGSQTAKMGFKNEQEIADKFNSWQTDRKAREWLAIMDYPLNKIEGVKAEVLSKTPNPKPDISVRISIQLRLGISIENISIKLVSNRNGKGFNQIDKRSVDSYVKLWDIPLDIAETLKRFTGELEPIIPHTRDRLCRRMYINEFSDESKNRLIKFLEQNQLKILKDIFQGHEDPKAGWLLVTWLKDESKLYVLKSISEVMNHYRGSISLSKRGSIKIGHITMQRKGGDRGNKTAQYLQFKINPCELFSLRN